MVGVQPEVLIYTDGAAEPNPGPGGYGVVLLSGRHRKELSGGYQLTTNNRMELMAVIAGLEALTKPSSVTVYSDSRYIVDAVNSGAVIAWRSNEWWRTKTEKAKNADLWDRFLTVQAKHKVTLQWVPGHRGIAENERCDQLATQATKSTDLLIDVGYQRLRDSLGDDGGLPAMPKITHTQPGEPCRACGTPLIKAIPKPKKRKPSQRYYYEWYLRCPGCRAMYMVESAKRHCDEGGSMRDGAR